MSRNRYRTARIAQDGACNPIPLLRALPGMVEEIRAENAAADTADILNDVALRATIHQLAHLFRIADFDAHYCELMAQVDAQLAGEQP